MAKFQLLSQRKMLLFGIHPTKVGLLDDWSQLVQRFTLLDSKEVQLGMDLTRNLKEH